MHSRIFHLEWVGHDTLLHSALPTFSHLKTLVWDVRNTPLQVPGPPQLQNLTNLTNLQLYHYHAHDFHVRLVLVVLFGLNLSFRTKKKKKILPKISGLTKLNTLVMTSPEESELHHCLKLTNLEFLAFTSYSAIHLTTLKAYVIATIST